MSALVCLYVIGITTLVAATAAGIEWAVQGRIPTRHLWSAAIVCALLIPPLAIVQHARGLQRPTTSPAKSAIVEVVQFGHVAGAALGSRDRGSPLHTLRNEYHTVIDRVSELQARTILELWMAASLALIAWMAYGAVHWDRQRREWEATELDGVAVHLSADTGPAVLGVLSQRIVLPAWVRTLAPECRQLMLAHECEHIAARDPQRLALALGALVLMPWNPALWWCAARMRRAIEMDCDARVLQRHPSPRAYGYLLLQVAARGNNAGPLAVPLVNLLRLPSELELRLRAMTRPRTIGGRTALAGAACAIAALSAAFTAPVPAATRPTIRNLVQATKARMAHGERAVRAVVGDTIPNSVAEDSIRRMARQIEKLTRQLDSARAYASLQDARVRTPDERLMLDRRRRLDSAAAHPDSLTARLRMLDARIRVPDPLSVRERMRLDSAAHDPNGKQMRALRRMDAALAKYYPDVSWQSIKAPGAIWFLADSGGKVLETRRVARGTGRGFPAPAEKGENVDFVTVRSTGPGRTPRFSVVWMQLKK